MLFLKKKLEISHPENCYIFLLIFSGDVIVSEFRANFPFPRQFSVSGLISNPEGIKSVLYKVGIKYF